MKKIVHLIFGFLLIFGCKPESKESMPITDFPSNDLDKVYLVDVRTPDEYAAGHIKGSVNIDIQDSNFENKISKMDKDKTVYVYCKAGGRSAKAQKMLQNMGFKHVVNLEGGFDQWKQTR